MGGLCDFVAIFQILIILVTGIRIPYLLSSLNINWSYFKLKKKKALPAFFSIVNLTFKELLKDIIVLPFSLFLLFY